MSAPENPTGEQLYAELVAAASRAGMTVRKFAAPLFSKDSSWKVEQLRIALRPLPSTVARVRALCAGEPLPSGRPGPHRVNSCGGILRGTGDRAGAPGVPGDMLLARRALTDRAHAERLPGETLHAAIRRLTKQDQTIAELEGVE